MKELIPVFVVVCLATAASACNPNQQAGRDVERAEVGSGETGVGAGGSVSDDLPPARPENQAPGQEPGRAGPTPSATIGS